MRVEIPGREVGTEEDLHRILASQLDFGPCYGKNQAALYDRLRYDVERPVELVWRDSATSRSRLGENLFAQILEIFSDIQEEDQKAPYKEVFVYTLA